MCVCVCVCVCVCACVHVCVCACVCVRVCACVDVCEFAREVRIVHRARALLSGLHPLTTDLGELSVFAQCVMSNDRDCPKVAQS